MALNAEYILVLHFSVTITMKERIKVKWYSWQLENNLRGVLALAFGFSKMDCINRNREMMLEKSHTAFLPGISTTLAEPAV